MKALRLRKRFLMGVEMSHDNVNFKMSCPICAKEITGFQTKDLDCNFEVVKPYVTN